MVKGTGGDTDERRKIEFEISPHYSINYTPKMEFGHIFFNDWSVTEWQLFDTLLLRSVEFFITKGIINPPQINLIENKLKQNTHPEFILFADNYIELEKQYNKATMLTEFQKICPAFKNLSGITFKKWIDKWGNARGYILNHFKSNGNAMLIVSPKS